MFNFVQRRKWYFLFSAVLIAISVAAMGLSIATYPERSPVRLSIDFLGGSLFEIQFRPLSGTQTSGEITESLLREIYGQFSVNEVRVQRLTEIAESNPTGRMRWQVRTGFIENDATERLKRALDDAARVRGFQLDNNALRVSQVSPTVGAESGRAAIIAVVVASIVITGFIVFAFRQVPNAFRYGMCAILAMIHDIVILVGGMSILGLLVGWEADALFLTALLTVVAYSVQDSIVVFDRIRENTARHRGEPYEMIVNRSIMETVQRSITTQILISFVLVSLMLMGGETIRPFVTVLLIGLISGTYSSIFIGIPLLAAWEQGELPLLNRTVAARA
jgi:preprotein translocase SecF subunit